VLSESDDDAAEGVESLQPPAGDAHPRSTDGATREHTRDDHPEVHGPHGNGTRANGTQPGDPEVTDLLGVLRRRRWWIAAVLAVAALVGYGIGLLSAVEKRAETRLLLVDTSEESVESPASGPLPLDERQSAVVSRAESQRTRAEVTRALALEPGDIKSISASAAVGQSFVTITVTTDDGVDAAAVTDRVATSVVEQQRDAVRERLEALAEELRQAATGTNDEIAAVDAQLAPLSREIATLQVQVDRSTGTTAGVDPLVELALKNDQATGLRSTRAALVTTQSDYERRARDADVAAAVSSGGVQVYETAGTVHTTRAVPPVQMGVLLASIALIVMVGAAYFTAYRADVAPRTPAPVVEPGRNGRGTVPRQPRQDDDRRADDGDAAGRAERT
jgi:uncharacterized protein involved in exopolysaccharide biosynthesis